jgi:hypothetical protein
MTTFEMTSEVVPALPVAADEADAWDIACAVLDTVPEMQAVYRNPGVEAYPSPSREPDG